MRALCFLFLGCLACTVGCVGSLQRFEYTAVVMAADARLVLYAPDEAVARAAARAAIERMHELDRTLSDHREDSELSRLTTAPHNTPHRISEDLFRVLIAAEQIGEETGGAFDVTVGPMTRLWREARNSGVPPDAQAMAKAQSLIGWDLFTLDPHERTAMLAQPGMQLDLGGIGKGFAVDQAMAVLRRHGLTRCLVGLSGDIAVSDPPPGHDGWTIAIAHDADAEPTFLTFSNAAISTSGNQYQFIVVEDVRRSHIIDPSSASFGAADRSAITVVGPDATTADAFATALMVLDPDAVKQLLELRTDLCVIMHEYTESR